MIYRIDRPRIPVIWLDTHAINKFAYALARPTASAANIQLRELFDKICSLRREHRIICFESDQLTEIEVRPELVEVASRVLAQTSQGLSTHYQFPLSLQDQIAMKAACEHVNEVTIEFRTAFNMSDPLADHNVGGFIVRARFPRSDEEIARTKETNRSIANTWEVMRQENINARSSFRERVNDHTRREGLAGRDIFIRVFNQAISRRMNGQIPTQDEFFEELEFLGSPITIWKQYGGNDNIEEIAEFFASSYYTSLPYIDIRSQLTAYRIAGNETIKPSDVMDIHNISAFLPYCSIMVLDRSMIEAVNWLGLPEKYDVNTITLQRLADFLPSD